ncbi:MAG: hypothetical protein ACYC99_06055 [Candidatus Geothermincolia bacterium]
MPVKVLRTVVALIFLGSAFAAASCSNDAPRAKEILKKAEVSARPLADILLKLNDEVEIMCADLVAGFNTEPSGLTARTEDFTRRIKTLTESAGDLRSQYAEVSKMKVPTAYSKYASVMMSTIDQVGAVEAAVSSTVKNITATMDSEAGPDVVLLEKLKRTLEGIDEKLRYYEEQAGSLRGKIGL